MGLKIPNLDKKDFEIFMQESMAKLPSYSQEWTEYNLSDPGITILELLSWMGDINSYRLNRVGEEHYWAFLKLLLLDKSIEKKDENEVETPLKDFTLGESNGYAKQRFELPKELREVSVSQMKIGTGSWTRANEFFSASGTSEIYMIENGWLIFGDDAYGKIPPRGESISFKGQVHSSEASQKSELFELFMNFREDLMLPSKAVTLGDYEFLALNTPNTKVARAKAVVESSNKIKVLVIFTDKEKENSLDNVKVYLEEKKLLTTRVVVSDEIAYKPIYLKIQIETKYANPLTLKSAIASQLQRFFDALFGGQDEKGWGFGEDVYLAELYKMVYEMKGVDKIDTLILSDERDGSALKRVAIDKIELPLLKQLVIEVNSMKKLGVCDGK